jgi:2-oxoisovalerate dehydrogenase E2 component (dihydrolipoyl transacylase)
MPQYNMPDPGEGLTEADIVEWHVAIGDEVKVNDNLLDIETAKSLVELPSPFAGKVTKIYAPAGSTVEVGKAIVFIDDGTGPAPEPDDAPDAAGAGNGAGDSASAAQEASPANDQAPAADAVSASEAEQQLAGAMTGERLRSIEELSSAGAGDHAVRQMLVGYGPGDEATPSSLERRRRAHQVSRRDGEGRPQRDQEIPVDTVRRITARNVVSSRTSKVHTSAWVSTDVTGTMDLVAALRKRREFRDLHVTPLLVWCKAVCLAMRNSPMLNASWAPDDDRIVLHHDVNIGIAADTPRGLMVPVIRKAQDRDLLSMADELTRLVGLAKAGTLQPSDYRDGTFTITNVGGLGLDAGTPIINGGESAILAMGAITRQPWVIGEGEHEQIVPRWVTTLSISFDHRLIDGAIASRFLRDLAMLVHNPAMAMAY